MLCFQNCSQVAFQAIPEDPLANKEALRSLEPALAVRAVGCVQCHANLSANLVTDFGYGDQYYFGRNIGGSVVENGSPYGDHGFNFHTIKMAADKKVFVPNAILPKEVADHTKLERLSDYIKSRFAASSFEETKAVEVKEISRVYIAAPTEAELQSAFALGNARSKFISSNGTPLSGMKDNATYFSNYSTVRCDGDLILKGPVFFKDLQVETQRGCRIHVIGSVFSYGGINMVGTSALRNVQFTATRSINMGLGTVVKSDNTFCNPDSKHAKGGYGTDSLENRYVTMWTVPSQNLRGVSDPKAFGESVVAEARTIEAGIGSKLQDADCLGDRAVAFERILLNAPVVMSRYNGNIKGTIVAEWALMSLGAFKFEFDSVFTQVDVLPRLEQASFLTIQH